ncbi:MULTISPECIES: YitT family protein [unclassified Exiguobacterium]|uniref:YitT family protein n=1 Tax=unclassified Exiguobacterium TaxID=2644629 RepID=UPI0025B9C7AF|nr:MULTISPECIES: YitT family protein [unclassified Exiguobacterium]
MKRIATILTGTLIMAFGYYTLNEQFGLAEGGFIGLSLLGRYFFDINPSISMIVLDIPFFIGALYFKGKRFVSEALLSAGALSLFYEMWHRLDLFHFPEQAWPATLIAAIASGIVTGYGLGLVLKSGAATGGDDLLSMGLSKLTGLSIGTILFGLDAIVLIISLVYLPLSLTLYTLLAVAIAGRVVAVMTREPIIVPAPVIKRVTQ